MAHLRGDEDITLLNKFVVDNPLEHPPMWEQAFANVEHLVEQWLTLRAIPERMELLSGISIAVTELTSGSKF